MENSRKPTLIVEGYLDLEEDGKPVEQDAKAIENSIRLNVHSIDMTDAENGINYRDISGKIIHVEKDEIFNIFRIINIFPNPHIMIRLFDLFFE